MKLEMVTKVEIHMQNKMIKKETNKDMVQLDVDVVNQDMEMDHL